VRFSGPATVGVVALVATASGAAAEPPEARDRPGGLVQWAGVTGSLRGGYWSSSRSLDDREHLGTASVWLKAAPSLGPNAALTLDGWVMNQELVREDETRAELREAYLDLRLGAVDLRVGQQIVAWGRADRINPTDNVTPRDFTLLVPEDDDQRLGGPAVKATYYLGTLSLTGLWLPGFEPHTLPLERPPAGSTLRERVPRWPLGQWAIRIERTGEAFDWSLSYFDGFDLFPDLGLDRITPSGVDLRLRYHRIRVIGADAATTLGRYGLRGEAAYAFTEDARGTDPEVKNPFLFIVVGGDRTFLEDLNINLQYILRVVSRFRDPDEIPDPVQRDVAVQQAALTNQIDRVQHGASLRISRTWWNQTLEGELAGIVSFTRLDVMVRPKLTYAMTDRFKLTVGADVFSGPRGSFFGRLRDNTTAYAEIRYSF
jgi:hypothetical protein